MHLDQLLTVFSGHCLSSLGYPRPSSTLSCPILKICFEIGKMAGCTITPLAFTMAMEVIIRDSKWVVGGERLTSEIRLPPIRAYMDDMTTMTTTVPCTRRLLGKLQENITGARMKFKPSKLRSISIVKGQLEDQRLYIDLFQQ